MLAYAASASAQSGAASGQLAGSVNDATQSALAGAVVRATHTATGLTRQTASAADGRFVLPALPPGVYTLTIELAGFAPHRADNLELRVGESVSLPVTLRLSAKEEVIVIDDTGSVDLSGPEVAAYVPAYRLEALPLNGRNFLSLALLAPGVTTDRTPAQGAAATSGLTFLGQPARYNNITVDGLDNNEVVTGSVRDAFSQDAVLEFQVLAAGYAAEFGKSSGGVVNIVTRAGGNTLAGSAFVYGRHDALNGRQYFERFTPAGAPAALDKSPLRQWQFGGTVGGPIVRDRMWYFASVERVDQQAANLVTIDQAAARVLGASGYTVETGHVPFDRRSTQVLLKVDRMIGEVRRVGVRVATGTRYDENLEPWGGLVARSGGALLDSRDTTIAASLTDPLSGRLLHDLRGQYSYRHQDVLSLDPSCGGPCTGELQGLPQIEIPGVAIAGRQRFTPSVRASHRLQVVDTVNYVAASHLLKAGADYSYVDFADQRLPLLMAGRYLFPGLTALSAGTPGIYAQGYGDSSNPFAYHDVSVFGQDDWTVGDRLSINAGVRYQVQVLPRFDTAVPGLGATAVARDRDNVAPRVAARWYPGASSRTVVRGAYGLYFGNEITAMSGVAGVVGDDDGVRVRLVAGPAAAAAWQSPGHRAPEPGSAYPRLTIAIEPDHETPFTRQAVAGIHHELPGALAVTGSVVYARGFNYPGTLDYNPLVAELGPNRRPLDAVDPATGQPIPGSSASVIQFTSYGQSWYKGLTLALTRRGAGGHQLSLAYTLSKAEDLFRDHVDTVPQSQGRGRNPADPAGLPLGFDPVAEKALSHQDQRHRLVLSGVYQAPGRVQVAGILTAGSGRPYTIVAGVDLNRDGDAGTSPSDRARTNPADPASSVGRNAGTMPAQATLDLRVSRPVVVGGGSRVELMFEVFNVFNRTNFTEINNVFGTGAYPSNPLPAFGQFTQAGPARQMQVAARLRF